MASACYRYRRRRLPVSLCCLATAFWISCGQSPVGLEDCGGVLEIGSWTRLGLAGRWVTAVAATPWGLYAGTHEDGVFRFDPGRGCWDGLGLDHAIVSAILFVPTDPPRLLVGLEPYADEQTEAAVFASENRGRTWQPWDGGLAARRDNRGWAFSLAMDPGWPERLYMGYFNLIARSEDGGHTWEIPYGDETTIGGTQVLAILVSPARDGRVWAAGETAIFTAFVRRLSDWGDTWEGSVDPTPGSENIVWALAADEDNTDRLWAGAEGGAMRSDDSGQTWRYVLNFPGAVHALVRLDESLYAISSQNFRIASDGSGAMLSDLGLYCSLDGGESWETLTVPESVGGGQAAVVDSDGQLVIGTRLGTEGAGVWRVSTSACSF